MMRGAKVTTFLSKVVEFARIPPGQEPSGSPGEFHFDHPCLLALT
jgi:hypothetical protein